MRSAIAFIDCRDGLHRMAGIAQLLCARDEAGFGQPVLGPADEFTMVGALARAGHRLRDSLFVSPFQHCLTDRVRRHQIGEPAGHMAWVVRHRQEAESLPAFYDVPFHHLPVTSADKLAVEQPEIPYRRQALSCGARARRKTDRGYQPLRHRAIRPGAAPRAGRPPRAHTHRDPVRDLIQKGCDLEGAALGRAVRWQRERRILFCGNETVVFD